MHQKNNNRQKIYISHYRKPQTQETNINLAKNLKIPKNNKKFLILFLCTQSLTLVL